MKRKMVSVMFLFSSTILILAASSSLSKGTSGGLRVVYVSRAQGQAKTASCGRKSTPCKTLELGFKMLAWNGRMYVDGNNTDKDPYTCEQHGSPKKEFEIQKSFTFLSYANSTARIACSNGIVIEVPAKYRPTRRMKVNIINVMFVDSKRLWVKNKINVSLNNVSFNNTKLQLTDASSDIKDCTFQRSNPAIYAWISNTLPSYYLKVKNTLFKENCGCIEIYQPRRKKAKGCNKKIILNFQDILFQGNTILMTTIPKDRESGLVYVRGSINCQCKNMSFSSKWKNVTVIDNQGELKFCNKTREEKQPKECCWKRKGKPNEFTRNIFAVHACKVYLRFSKVKSLNNVNTRFLMSRSRKNNIKVVESTYQGHRIDNPGGVILVKGNGELVNLTIINSNFFNNSGTLGGVLQIDGGEFKVVGLDMNNVSLVHSHGSDFGCVVSVANVNSNHKSSYVSVATLNAKFNSLLVKNTRFSYNITKGTTKEHHYAAFCFVASNFSQISIKKTLFSQNDVPAFILRHKSTDLLASAKANIKIDKTDFIENYSPRKNAIFTLMLNEPVQKSSLIFYRTTFKRNNGTAIIAKNVVNMKVKDFTCTHNSWKCMLIESKHWLKKVFSVNSTLKIENSVFTHNLNSPIEFIHTKPRFLEIEILNSSFHKNRYREALSIEIGFQKRNNTLIQGKLVIRHTNFTSNSVDFAHTHVLRFILLVPTKAKFNVRIFKTIFRNNVQHHKASLPGISNSLFFFYMPEDFESKKGKKCRKFPFFKYQRKISFDRVVFENNTGSSSMLHISNGLNSFYRCLFKNSFAKYPRSGAHVFIEVGTARVLLHWTVFEQTKISNCKPCNDYPCKHSASVLPFIYTAARGRLIIKDSNFTLHSSERKSNMFIIENGRFVKFDSRTKLRCPIGSYIRLENSSHVIQPKFTRDHCRLNITRMRFVCKMCPISTYSLERGSFRGLSNKTNVSCLVCPFGGSCTWNIKSRNDFWGYLSSPDPPRLRFANCPEHYCSMPQGTDTSVYNKCSGNRSGLMCGTCKEGFTESLFNHYCRPVDECRDIWFWVIAVLYSVIMGVYILLRPPIVMQLVKKTMWCRQKMPQRTHEQAETTDGRGEHGYSKIIFYFYQVADLLMLESSCKILQKQVFIATLVSFYNFQIDVADSSFGCPFPGLTAVTKELFRSLQVFAVMVFLLVFYFLHWLLWSIRRRPRPHFAPYLAAIIEVLLLGYERLAHTSFNLLTCTPLTFNNQVVWKMFIDGNITCWVHWWQYAMIAYNIVFVIPFMLVLLVGTLKLQRGQIGPFQFLAACFVPLPFLVYWMLKRMSDRRLYNATGETRNQQYTKHFLEVIQGPFRPPKDQSKGALYWESILIGRRLVLLCLHSLVTAPMLRMLSMTFICLLILLHDVVIMPFKDKKTNAVAAFLLSIHVVLGAINLAKATLINAGVSPKGPPKTEMHGLRLLEIALLSILPCAFLLLVVACLMSQAIRLIFKGGSYLFSKIFSQQDGSWYPRQGRKCLEESYEPLLDPAIN